MCICVGAVGAIMCSCCMCKLCAMSRADHGSCRLLKSRAHMRPHIRPLLGFFAIKDWTIGELYIPGERGKLGRATKSMRSVSVR